VIGSLRGVLLDRIVRPGQNMGEVLVEVAGVGYRVQGSAVPLAGLGEPGSQVFLHIHTHVREDAIILYGFSTRDERQCFETLIGAHGVGPAVALALLSVHSPAALRRVVATEDAAALTLVPGIGPKTASRLLIELKSRLDLDIDLELSVSRNQGADPGALGSTPRAEVRAALAGLGYGYDEVRDVVGRLPEQGSTELLLRTALRQLAGAR
jgi:Holliday junction DNA helicase RuvA